MAGVAWRRAADGPVAPASGREVLAFGARFALAAVLLQSVVHLLNLGLYDLRIDALNVDSDTSAFAWASIVATFGVALLLAQLWLLGARPAALPLGLAVALAFLSLDDMLGLHERVSALESEFAGIEHFSRLFWPLVFMPLLGASFLGLWVVASRMGPAPARLLRRGLGLLAAAILLEMASPALFAVGLDHGDLGYELEVVLEEGAELGGWMLIAAALIAGVFERAAATRDAPGA